MSAFDALDVRGPDARRKQLLAKLMQQAQQGAPGGAASVTGPLGGHLGGLAEGRSFRNATDVHRAGALPITQSSNVLSSVLAKLGVVGHAQANEVSPGEGMSIDVHAPSGGAALDLPQNAAGNASATEITSQPGIAANAAAPPPATDIGTGSTAPVPLGNGLYYDPVTDAVRGMPSGMLGAAARRTG